MKKIFWTILYSKGGGGSVLHYPTEGEDHKVSHAKQESEVDDVIEDVVEGVSIHRGEACEDGGHDIPISIRVPKEGKAKKCKAEEHRNYTDESPSYNRQGERDCSCDEWVLSCLVNEAREGAPGKEAAKANEDISHHECLLLDDQHNEASSYQENVRKQKHYVPIVKYGDLLPERQIIPLFVVAVLEYLLEVHLLDILLILSLASIVSFVQVLYPLFFLLFDPQVILGEQIELCVIPLSLDNHFSSLLRTFYVHHVHIRYLNQLLLL